MEIKNWGDAHKWQERANGVPMEKQDSEKRPMWCFDTGYKLNYDGSIFSISSRFYPPHKQSGGKGWSGVVILYIMDDVFLERHVKSDTLDELKSKVEAYINEMAKNVWEMLNER